MQVNMGEKGLTKSARLFHAYMVLIIAAASESGGVNFRLNREELLPIGFKQS